MREQVLDGHVVRDEREIVAEKRARGRRELERPVLDETHDGECGQTLHAARDREPRVGLVRDLVAAVRKAVRLVEDDLVATVDADDAREALLGGERVDVVDDRHDRRQRACGRSCVVPEAPSSRLSTDSSRAETAGTS